MKKIVFLRLHTNNSIDRNDGAEKESCGQQASGVVFMSGGITYDGHISMLVITELELGSSENSYSRAR